MRRKKQQSQRKKQKGWSQQNSISESVSSARRQVNECPQGSYEITQ